MIQNTDWYIPVVENAPINDNQLYFERAAPDWLVRMRAGSREFFKYNGYFPKSDREWDWLWEYVWDGTQED